MASSLLFRIKSVFDNKGFKEARSSFTGLLGAVGSLTVGLAKLALSARGIGTIAALLTLQLGIRLVRGTITASQATARAELSFNRLRSSLELLGQGSEENIKRVTDFARSASEATRFSAIETQEAVNIAVRRTGNLEDAIKAVSVAQDIASSTGRDLVSTTKLLNSALAGNTRFLLQITDLRRSDIQAARRQGRLLDLLAERFGGIARREANTFIGRQQVLANVTEQLQNEIGELGLGIRRLGLEIDLFARRSLLFLVRTAKDVPEIFNDIQNSAVDVGISLGRFIQQAVQGGSTIGAVSNSFKQFFENIAEGSREAGDRSDDFFFDFEQEAERLALRVGKTTDERRQLARDLSRANEILRIAEQSGVEAITKEQFEFGQQFQFFNKRLREFIQEEIDQKEKASEQARNAARELAEASRNTSILGAANAAVQEQTKLRDALRQNGFEEAEINRILSEQVDLRRQGLNLTREAAELTAETRRQTQQEIERIFDTDRANNFRQTLETIKEQIELKVRPVFSPTIEFSVSPEILAQRLVPVIQTQIQQLLDRLERNARNQQRQNEANSSVI